MKPAKPINRELKTVTPRHETGPTTDPLSTDGEFEITSKGSLEFGGEDPFRWRNEHHFINEM